MKVLNLEIKNSFYPFLLFTIVFHILFMAHQIYEKNSSFLKTQEDDLVSELKIKILNEVVRKQVVETVDSKDIESHSKKIFLSDKNNVVTRETRARNVGVFNKGGSGSKAQNKEMSLSDLMVDSKLLDNKGLNKLVKKEKSIKSSSGKGLSQSNDYIENIALGDFTKVNTQEYEFYGFYHRIKEKLEQFWGRNIEEEASKLYKAGRRMPASDNHVTSLKVVLNEKGQIVKIHINSTSGVRELDKAAVDAFNQAGPFPNPPKGMLHNGEATIEWGFVVNT